MLRSLFRPPLPEPGLLNEAAHQEQHPSVAEEPSRFEDSQFFPVPYDENLLEKARTQWQFGDWASLTRLDRDVLQHHPDRAKLALLAAAGHHQINDMASARQFIRLAQDWGCSKKLISQVLIAGVHNCLGRAAALSNEPDRAVLHFESAIRIGAPSSEIHLLTQARAQQQITGLGLPLPANTRPSRKAFASNALALSEIRELVDKCLQSEDVHESIDTLITSGKFTNRDLTLIFSELADRYSDQNDPITSLHFLQKACEHLETNSDDHRAMLIRKLIEIKRPELAADLAMNAALTEYASLSLTPEELESVRAAYSKQRDITKSKSAHGHDLLLRYLQSNLKRIKESLGRPLICIEIGSTREEVPDQGSTRQIAEYCKKNSVHFITVDMDPHNSRSAEELFSRLGVSFVAINQKGEDYLRDYNGVFDFIFLDAYDFDHGRHSTLRQSRYAKFLGAAINDSDCHTMHLECARHVLEKLSPEGIVCMDDTWLEDGKWTAKGTLAMPFLLEHGFTVLEARNRAALLARTTATNSSNVH